MSTSTYFDLPYRPTETYFPYAPSDVRGDTRYYHLQSEETIPLDDRPKTPDQDSLLVPSTRSAAIMADTSATRATFWLMSGASFVLSALSIIELGLVSSMVGWVLHQKDHIVTYEVAFPSGTVQLVTHPEHFSLDQGHVTNGVAGYGFFLGLIAMWIAFRQRRRQSESPSKTLSYLLTPLVTILPLFTLSALIYVFYITNHTNNQTITSPPANSNVRYPLHTWTPETWYKAVLQLPLAGDSAHRRSDISSAITNMVAWRWMLVPLFIVDLGVLAVVLTEVLRQRRVARVPTFWVQK